MSKDLFSLSSYKFHLPPELIAQQPCAPRDASRLMVIDRSSGNITEMIFRELKDFLNSGDQLIFNDTKVIPARLFGKRQTGGQAEILLIRQYADKSWEVLARPGRRMRPNDIIRFSNDFSCKIVETLPSGSKRVEFIYEGDFYKILDKYGQLPLPHYIEREAPTEDDKERYQTVYANKPGAAAAPTAGLHFTKQLMTALAQKKVKQSHITLHTGLGTFKPVQVEDIRQHQMHVETCIISQESAIELNNHNKEFRQICVGTTCCRSLESATNDQKQIIPGQYETNIFIHPGYQFKFVNSLLTNFHFPESTLLMLVCAFAGYELTMEAYKKAVKEKYRFFSYGDAMLIL